MPSKKTARKKKQEDDENVHEEKTSVPQTSLKDFYLIEKGTDTNGKSYNSLSDMWKAEFGEQVEQATKQKDEIPWYHNADEYWKAVDATMDGVMGGFAHISSPDVKGSAEFIEEFIAGKHGVKLGTTLALDCGAGIGRITKELLLKYFTSVDLLDQNPKFLEKAKENLKEFNDAGRTPNYFCCSMHEFVFPEATKYDVIWLQWVSSHLTDEHFLDFLKRCQGALSKSGIVVVKENNSPNGFIVDKEDSSITRSDAHFQTLFREAGLELLKVKLQPKFPKELFPVRMYALK